MTDWTHTWYTNHVGTAWVLLEEAETHIEKLKQEVEHANELCIRDLKHVERRADEAEAKAAELERMLLIHWQHQHNLVYDTDPADGTSYDDWLADLRKRAGADG